MHALADFILLHASSFPWILFFSLLLAGCSIPISIDLLLVLTAFLSATLFEEQAPLLFGLFTLGCILSAWIAYWIGRLSVGPLKKLAFFSKMLTDERQQKILHYYRKWGFWSFLIARFIPFGVRNCFFMFSGMWKISFTRFVLFDGIACIIWSTIFFFLFYRLGQNHEVLLSHLKIINLCIFAAFSVTVIVVICYKWSARRKKYRG
jgi:membrane-associated protein